jgi:hypothetical protein
MPAAEGAVSEIGVDDDIRRRQHRTGQMMIGDQHVHAGRARSADTRLAADAVVHGDDQARRATQRQCDDLGRESIAELEPIRHQEIYRRKTPAAQGPHQQCRAGRTIGIEVADDQDQTPAIAVLQQQCGCGLDRAQCTDGQQLSRGECKVGRTADAAGRVDPA